MDTKEVEIPNNSEMSNHIKALKLYNIDYKIIIQQFKEWNEGYCYMIYAHATNVYYNSNGEFIDIL